MAQETELKFTPPENVTADTLFRAADILPHCGEIRRISMHTEYLDTADGEAAARGITLRRRLENGRSVIYAKCTESASGALSVRGEWSVLSDDIQNATRLLAREGAPTDALCGAPLCVCASVRFERCEALVSPHEGFSFMLSYDEGYFGENTRFTEVELELVSGSAEELVVFGGQLAGRYNMKPEPRSKYARALALR